VKPGVTGLWQVIARTDPSFESCVTLDLEYMKRWSLWLDLKILMRTVPAVLAGEGS
jgi:lipopolysaccharide/colanic/teichoic acid biosynthesis glycosyltransferase